MGFKELDLLPAQVKFDDETTAQSLFGVGQKKIQTFFLLWTH